MRSRTILVIGLLATTLSACGASRPDPATVNLKEIIDSTPPAWGVGPAFAVDQADIKLDGAGAPIKEAQQPWIGSGFGGNLMVYLYADDKVADENFEILKLAHDEPNAVPNLGEEGYLAIANNTAIDTSFRRCNAVVLLQVVGKSPENTPTYMMDLDRKLKAAICP